MKEEKLAEKRKFMKSQKSGQKEISDDCQKPRKFLKPGRTNREDRINFVKFWADYVRTHSDEDWSKQQNMLIDSIIKE